MMGSRRAARSIAAFVAVGVNADGPREVLGMDMALNWTPLMGPRKLGFKV
jgi:hypothetical protein